MEVAVHRVQVVLMVLRELQVQVVIAVLQELLELQDQVEHQELVE